MIDKFSSKNLPYDDATHERVCTGCGHHYLGQVASAKCRECMIKDQEEFRRALSGTDTEIFGFDKKTIKTLPEKPVEEEKPVPLNGVTVVTQGCANPNCMVTQLTFVETKGELSFDKNGNPVTSPDTETHSAYSCATCQKQWSVTMRGGEIVALSVG